MDSLIDLPIILVLLGSAQTFLLAFALLGLKRGFAPANRFLVAFLLIISIALFSNILTDTNYFLLFPHSVQIFAPLQFLYAPLFFLYIKTLIFRKSAWNKWSWLHFLPFLLCILYLMPFYLQSAEYKINYKIISIQNIPPDWKARNGLVFLQQIIYFGVLIYMTARYRAIQSKNELPHNVNLYWVWGLIVTFLVIWGLGVARLLFAFRFETNLIIPVIVSLWAYVVGYLTLRKPELIVGLSDENFRKKYEKSALSPDRAERYLQRLIQIMQTEKPYLDSELTIQKLARQISVSPPHLSQIINENLNQNFAEFVNSYRVEEIKRKLAKAKDKHLSLIAIAELSGFKSKSAFNTAFKKQVGMTPSEFRKTVSE